ncbi:MAG: hypothetical protein KF791_06565 [Verrucomicrobiae bacterium]|nr:hypothetical protein [Verrucomicrobiae bacterium]
MSQRRLLIDNDAFILLAGAGYLQTGVEVLGFAFEDARRLDSLEFMLRKQAKCLLKYFAEVRNRALEQCSRVPGLNERPAVTVLAQFAEVPNMDDGEALLYGLAAELPLHYLASNDKQAMVAVATDPRLTAIRAAVAGKVICVEAVTRLLIAADGAGAVAERFGGLNCSDKRLASILSPATTGRPEDCLTAADSNLESLRRQLGTDFLFQP